MGRTPSLIRAHTRWKASPANGYARITFVRQVRDEDTSRQIVLFDWLRDWPEDDRLVLHRARVFRSCVVAR